MMIEVARMNERLSTVAERIGTELLGPVVHRWMLALHQYSSYLDDGDTEFLYCARAGVRIKKLFELYLGESCNWKVFWSSRVATCKGTYRRFPTGANEILVGEYRHDTMQAMVSGILRNTGQYAEVFNFDTDEFALKGEHFGKWLRSGSTDARIMINYLEHNSVALDKYLKQLIGSRKKVVLIDSGWQGTVQWLLSNAYPDVDWKGLYFGRIMQKNRGHDFADHVIGLMFESEKYDPARPITAISHFHHLIERLLETRGPSIEEVPAGQYASVAKKRISENMKSEETAEEHDPLFHGVCEYLRANASHSISQIMQAYELALPELRRLVLFPEMEEALALGTADRSADFGKNLKVPILRRPDDFEDETSEARIERSLWIPGQIALEFPQGFALQRQSQVAGHSHVSTLAIPAFGAQRKVAIITRTKDRPILLRRAAASVAAQTHGNYVWIIVNDGGNVDSVTAVLNTCGVERHKIVLINNHVSHGMEAASNLGIRNSNSDYIVIHDDDDSWSPDFLEKTTAFLEEHKKVYAGVITRSVYVSEEISGDKVIEHSRAPYQDWVRNVHLAEMGRGNFFPPIAFLFRRSAYDEVGGYNEDLPVLGDWFFNMEFLLRHDIGVLRTTSAYYHHRDVGQSTGAYSNSVIGDISKHERYASISRNMFLRKYGSSNVAAFAAVSGYFAQETKMLEHKIEGRSSGASAVNWNAEQGLDVDAIDAEVDRLWLVNQLNAGYVFSITSNLTEYQQTMVTADASLDDLISTIMGLNIDVGPCPGFDDEAYLNRYADVAEVCASGSFRNGYIHYLAYGRGEGRKRFRRK
jgi:glycosyltransferase involved in cell wall biosynthesis